MTRITKQVKREAKFIWRRHFSIYDKLYNSTLVAQLGSSEVSATVVGGAPVLLGERSDCGSSEVRAKWAGLLMGHSGQLVGRGWGS